MSPLTDIETGTGLDARALHAHLAHHIPDLGPLSVRLIAGGRSNPTYLIRDADRAWVLRRPPHGLVLETAHDMGREFRVMNALEATAVPVPRTTLLCEDPDVIGAPFYLMEHLSGRTVGSPEAAAALSPGQRHGLAEAMLDTLAALHTIDPAQVGLADFGRPEGYLPRQLRRWQRQWDGAHTVDRPQVRSLIRGLEDSLPATQRTGIVHGDFKIDNVMVADDDPTRVLGLLDWEMSTLGDTLADVGLMLSFWDEPGRDFNPLTRGITALPGFPTAAQMLAGYADRLSLHDLDAIDWYVSLADLKIAVIFEQIHVRHVAGQTVGEGFEGMGDMVEPLLTRALDRLSGMAR